MIEWMSKTNKRRKKRFDPLQQQQQQQEYNKTIIIIITAHEQCLALLARLYTLCVCVREAELWINSLLRFSSYKSIIAVYIVNVLPLV